MQVLSQRVPERSAGLEGTGDFGVLEGVAGTDDGAGLGVERVGDSPGALECGEGAGGGDVAEGHQSGDDEDGDGARDGAAPVDAWFGQEIVASEHGGGDAGRHGGFGRDVDAKRGVAGGDRSGQESAVPGEIRFFDGEGRQGNGCRRSIRSDRDSEGGVRGVEIVRTAAGG